ncbi:hypothetical protein RFI_04981, partial [Reticulomyxa filosa]
MIDYHCFVLNSENGQGQEMMKTNQDKIKKFIKCCCFVERQDYQLNMMKITIFFNFINYLFVKVLHNTIVMHMCILMMQSYSLVDVVMVIQFEKTNGLHLKTHYPVHCMNCAAILSEEDSNIHIIGGSTGDKIESTHMKTKVREWDPSYL